MTEESGYGVREFMTGARRRTYFVVNLQTGERLYGPFARYDEALRNAAMCERAADQISFIPHNQEVLPSATFHEVQTGRSRFSREGEVFFPWSSFVEDPRPKGQPIKEKSPTKKQSGKPQRRVDLTTLSEVDLRRRVRDLEKMLESLLEWGVPTGRKGHVRVFMNAKNLKRCRKVLDGASYRETFEEPCSRKAKQRKIGIR